MPISNQHFRFVYLGIVGLSVVFMTLFPVWYGRSYNEYKGIWHDGGAFALQDAEGFEKRAPVWSVPEPHSPLIEAPTRWPWQQPGSRHHVEWAIGKMIAQLATIVLFAGLIPAIGNWRRRNEWSRLRRTAFAISVWLIVGFAAAGILMVLSAGYAMTTFNVLLILGISVFAGLVSALVWGPGRTVLSRTTEDTLQESFDLQ